MFSPLETAVSTAILGNGKENTPYYQGERGLIPPNQDLPRRAIRDMVGSLVVCKMIAVETGLTFQFCNTAAPGI
jgi:hypothetical protein